MPYDKVVEWAISSSRTNPFMSTHTEAPRRPNLEPIWTNPTYQHHNLNGVPRVTFGATPSPAGLSPSPMSPRTLPSPVYPRPYDGSMRSQERALVDSLNQRSGHPSLANPMSLMPIDEHSPLAARLEKAARLPPINAERRLPSPASPALTPPRELVAQFSEQYRPASVIALLRGPPAGLQYASPGLLPVTRRVSAPAFPQLATRRGSPMAARDQLRLWGHLYYGDAKTADAFVIARSLRRPQTSTVRAIVRPRAVERRPFLIQRTFDMDELRATIPDPPARSEGALTSGPTIGSGSSPGQLGASAPQHHQQPTSSSRRRSSSVKSGALLSSCSGLLDPESLMRDAKAVPIHLKYARAHLPVLAALLASGHVREGDVVYLPLPHPEAWPQTARYVYTGQGEPTLAVRENIAYLAGKV
ncbi:hypothetical protein DL767_009691 [Monosporascus sp. MG133]|nr:hypothetical protein DL767_009691 [Monosporascus sp. MG133]